MVQKNGLLMDGFGSGFLKSGSGSAKKSGSGSAKNPRSIRIWIRTTGVWCVGGAGVPAQVRRGHPLPQAGLSRLPQHPVRQGTVYLTKPYHVLLPV